MSSVDQRSKFWTRAALLLATASAIFAAGWWWGRQDAPTPSSAPSQMPSPDAAASAEVELRLDAGSVQLLPDGGLHLKPMKRLDPDELTSDP